MPEITAGLTSFTGFKIVESGLVTLTHTANTTLVSDTWEHHLGYRPSGVIAMVYESNAFYEMPRLQISTAGIVWQHASYQLDQYSINFYLSTPNVAGNTYYSGAYTMTFQYYLLDEAS